MPNSVVMAQEVGGDIWQEKINEVGKSALECQGAKLWQKEEANQKYSTYLESLCSVTTRNKTNRGYRKDTEGSSDRPVAEDTHLSVED